MSSSGGGGGGAGAGAGAGAAASSSSSSSSSSASASAAAAGAEPQELTAFVQQLLQQMQQRFQSMSDTIIGKSACERRARGRARAAARPCFARYRLAGAREHTRSPTLALARARAHGARPRRLPPAVDEMGGRIDELERSLGELMQQAGAQGGSGGAAAGGQ